MKNLRPLIVLVALSGCAAHKQPPPPVKQSTEPTATSLAAKACFEKSLTANGRPWDCPLP